MIEIDNDKVDDKDVKTLKSDVFKTAEDVRVVETEKLEKAAEVTAVKVEAEANPPESIVMWQFRFRRYRYISDVVDEHSPVLASVGKRSNLSVRARNWRHPLDLDIPDDLKMHKSLLSSPQCGVDFWLLTESSKEKSDLPSRANTLRKLNDMHDDQLLGMLDGKEREAAGILPGKEVGREELIIAIIDAKKLSGGNI